MSMPSHKPRDGIDILSGFTSHMLLSLLSTYLSVIYNMFASNGLPMYETSLTTKMFSASAAMSSPKRIRSSVMF